MTYSSYQSVPFMYCILKKIENKLLQLFGKKNAKKTVN